MAPEEQVELAAEETEGAPAGEPAPSAPSGDPEAPVSPPAPASAPDADSEGEPELSAPAAPAEEDLDALRARAQQADEYLELAQRTKADFENFRKRAARDAELAQQRGLAKLARELLPAVDNLERALAHAPEAGEPELTAFLDGIGHLHTDLIAALARTGIERYSPEGEPFDPQHHEAVAQQPVEGAAPGTVAEVYQRGYRMGELILRPARVLVAA